MKSCIFSFLTKSSAIVALFACIAPAQAQEDGFWDRVQFGGGLGIAFGSGYTDITVAPGALYRFNPYVATGLGVQGTYVNQRDYFSSFMYGPTAVVLFNPIPELQLSAEVEQLRVNLDVDERAGEWEGYADDFWNTGLFLGAGYSMENVTVGLRYNVLFSKDDLVYSDAVMPFVRVYF